MKIEVTDREYWLVKVNEKIQYVEDYRAKQDRNYEKQWRKRWLLPDRGPNEFPEKNVYYPSESRWGTLSTLKKLKVSLESDYTGTIYLEDNDLRTLDI